MKHDLVSLLALRGDYRPTPAWGYRFGPYKWFFVRDAYSLLLETETLISRIYADRDLIARVGKSLGKLFNERWASWTSLSHMQITAAVNGEPVRLDKAVFVLTLLQSSVVDGGSRSSVGWRLVSELARRHAILPSVFIIDGLRDRRLDFVEVERIAHATGQPSLVIQQMMRGRPVVEHIASSVASALHLLGHGRSTVRMLNSRRSPDGGLTAPCTNQVFRF